MAQRPDAVAAAPIEDVRIICARDALGAALLNKLEHKSLDQTSIRETDRRAGVGHATIYRHYATKEALLRIPRELAAARPHSDNGLPTDLNVVLLVSFDSRDAGLVASTGGIFTGRGNCRTPGPGNHFTGGFNRAIVNQ